MPVRLEPSHMELLLHTGRLHIPRLTPPPGRSAATIPIRPVTRTNRIHFQETAQGRKANMFKHLVALLLVAFAAAWLSPAGAQTPGTSVGGLSCRTGPSIGLIFGSQQRMACRFQPNGPFPPEAYVGVMNTVGLDIGITAGGALDWG